MIKNKNYDIFCHINKKKQIALTKNNQISFLKNFNLPEIKEAKSLKRDRNWKFLKNYKNSISNFIVEDKNSILGQLSLNHNEIGIEKI